MSATTELLAAEVLKLRKENATLREQCQASIEGEILDGIDHKALVQEATIRVARLGNRAYDAKKYDDRQRARMQGEISGIRWAMSRFAPKELL